MKRLISIVLLVLAAALVPVQAEGPDEEYVRIYNLIQSGDALSMAVEKAQALARYREAQTTLQRFQKGYPDWNPKVVNYRINYLTVKIAELTPKVPDATLAPVVKPTVALPRTPTAVVALPPKTAAPSELDRQLAGLQEDVRRLQADRSLLESKLKEALAAQPAAVDPRGFAKSREQVQSLSKENDLLKATLEAAKSKPLAAADSKALAETRRQLAEANRNLAERTDRANTLAAEKQQLQVRLDSSLATKTDGAVQLEEARKALDAANRKLSEQAELSKQLASEKNTLQERIRSLAAGADAAESLRIKNEVLKKQLGSAKAVAASSAQNADAARKLAQAEGRIATLESGTEILRLEKVALENRVRTLSSQPAAVTTVTSRTLPTVSRQEELVRIKQLETERNDLAKKLEAANKELYGRKSKVVSARLEELNNQITALRARLEVFEARAVPYTPEELALFKKPAPQLAAANPNAGKKSINELPSGSASFVVSAQRHFAAKEFDQAEQDYLQILRRDEKNVYTLANLAAIQLERGKLDEAEKSVKQALAHAPDDAYSLSILGYVKYRQEKFDEALDALGRAAKLNPQSAEIQNYLGVTLSQKGLRGPAETALRKAIQIDPGYGSAHNNLAVIYATQKPPSLELARWHYQKAQAAGHPRNEELEKAFAQKAAESSAP